MVYEDVLRHVNNLRHSVAVVAGQVKGNHPFLRNFYFAMSNTISMTTGKTVLPIPVENEKLNAAVKALEGGATGQEAHTASNTVSKYSHTQKKLVYLYLY